MTVRLSPMPDDRLPAWIEQRHLNYIASRMRVGESREVATAKAEGSRVQNFPGGRPLGTHLVYDVLDGATVVGHLWLGPLAASGGDWWVNDVHIDENHRRRGFARRALELGEIEVAARGGTTIGLNVFGYNTGAKELYDSLGYAVTATQMRKPV
jgi:ribosomal protein S18 acetylase RimI-like enzyme